ncbi:MAG: GrdX family protein [Spirochaetaceae bacterium]|nr:GrdX family protein [Spirochaetaceae bacterium]
MEEYAEKVIVTNNKKVQEKYSDVGYQVLFLPEVSLVYMTARDLIHKNFFLVNHSMTANIPIYKHPYRSLALKLGKSLHHDSLMLIERALEKLRMGTMPNYPEQVLQDFQDLDLTLFQEVKL